MITSQATQSPDFDHSIKLLLQLHRLTCEGRDESDEAEAVRDEMDTPWYRLTENEAQLIRGLSADLYTIGVDRPVPTSKPDELEWQEFSQAVEREAWSAALNLVRRCEECLSPAQVAYIRGACWAYIGQFDVAILFLQEKQRIEPLDPGEEVLLLTCLVQANRIDEATARASEIAENASNPALLLKAAEVLFVQASQLEEAQSESRHRYAISVARRGLELGERGSTDPLFDSLRAGAYLHVALSYDQLGQKDKAVETCEAALKLDPNHTDALMLHHYLTSKQYPYSETHRRLAASRAIFTSPASLIGSH